jgi:hypothetical protein
MPFKMASYNTHLGWTELRITHTVSFAKRKTDYFKNEILSAFKPESRIVMWEVADEYKFIKSTTVPEHIFWGIIGFYIMDFLRFFHILVNYYFK